MSATFHVPGGGAVWDFGPMSGVAHDAVDLLDVAARLESSGVSDRTAAQRHGRPDVFALAADIVRSQGALGAASARAGPRTAWAEPLRRAVLLLAGVLLVAGVFEVLYVPTRMVWIVGATGWIGGQLVAAIAWFHLGRGQAAVGLRRAGAATVLVVAAAAAAPAVLAPDSAATSLGMVLCPVWTAYACSISLLVCAGRSQSALVVVGLGLAVIAGELAVRPASYSTAVLVVAAATSGVVILLSCALVIAAGGPSVPHGYDLRAAVPAALQAGLLAISLLVLLDTIPRSSATPVVLATVVGAAMAEVAIALLRTRLQASAARLFVLAAAARKARSAALAAAAWTAAGSALVAVVMVLVLRVDSPDWGATLAPAAAFTALATTSAALTAFGAPWRAVLAAALTAAYAAGTVTSPAMALALVFPLALLSAVGLLLYRVSDPRVVA